MLSPRRYDLYDKAVNKPKKQIDTTMITVEEALLFAEWLADRYTKTIKGWTEKWKAFSPHTQYYTTRELWDIYQKFLGKK